MELAVVYEAIDALVGHAAATGLIEEDDRVYAVNRLLEKLGLDAYEPGSGSCAERFVGEHQCESGTVYTGLEAALAVLLDYAAERGLLESNSPVYRDLFDTELMGCLTPRPSEIRKHFKELYAQSPERATDWYYGLSRATDYIRTYRVARDIRWTTRTPYGEMIITINLSKPEKDPKAIAAALSMKQSTYPKCQLCMENEGYAGRVNHPARANHRIIPVTVEGAPWFLQYSPYVYYNEHCIVFNAEHTPMKIDRAVFDKLLSFIGQFPHYIVGSNADLPIVGGSILTHEHFQGGNFEFPMARAGIEQKVTIRGFDDIEAGIVKWPMTVIRLDDSDPGRLAECAGAVLKAWREYSDESEFIYAYSDAASGKPLADAPVDYEHHGDAYIPHNTITPIARMKDGRYELDLVLRNNITTEEHPLGVYHPHAEYHHIKKENIGLIEVMGLAILPARLKDELAGVKECILDGRDVRGDDILSKHADWVDMIRSKYSPDELSSEQSVDNIIRNEIGYVYSGLLEQCAVFDGSSRGRAALLKFIESIGD